MVSGTHPQSVTQSALMKRFLSLLPIDNPSGGEATIRELIARTLRDLGCTDQGVDQAGNLLVRVPGALSGSPILLSAHMDSVPPCLGVTGQVTVHPDNGRPMIQAAGETILGADDKAGIAMILELVEVLSRSNFQGNVPLELVFSVEEEIGLLGAKAFDCSQLKAPYGYVLDGDGPVSAVFVQGPSQVHFELTSYGKPSHAGIAPEQGVNAIHQLAQWVARVPFGRISPNTTLNIGIIEGGKANNVVPDKGVIRGEMRSLVEEELADLQAQLEEVTNQVNQGFTREGRLELRWIPRYSGFQVEPTSTVIQHLLQCYPRVGIQPQLKPMAIGSDAHIFNVQGVPSVVLGMGFHRSHSLGEHLYCEEYYQAFSGVLSLVTRLNSAQEIAEKYQLDPNAP